MGTLEYRTRLYLKREKESWHGVGERVLMGKAFAIKYEDLSLGPPKAGCSGSYLEPLCSCGEAEGQRLENPRSSLWLAHSGK